MTSLLAFRVAGPCAAGLRRFGRGAGGVSNGAPGNVLDPPHQGSACGWRSASHHRAEHGGTDGHTATYSHAQSDLHAGADAYSTAHANTLPDGHPCADADNQSDRHTSADSHASTHVHAPSDFDPTCDRANLGSRANSNRCANPSTHT